MKDLLYGVNEDVPLRASSEMLVEVDPAINCTIALRFKPDRIVGTVEKVRLLEMPKRSIS